MNKLSGQAVLAVSMALVGGCATMPPPDSPMKHPDHGPVVRDGPKQCGGGTTCEAWEFALTCQKTQCTLVDAPTIEIVGSQNGPTALVYHLPRMFPAFQFDPVKGISFGRDDIKCGPLPNSNGKGFVCVDRAPTTPPGDPGYKYSVTVVWHDQTFTIDPLDPWVVNK